VRRETDRYCSLTGARIALRTESTASCLTDCFKIAGVHGADISVAFSYGGRFKSDIVEYSLNSLNARTIF